MFNNSFNRRHFASMKPLTEISTHTHKKKEMGPVWPRRSASPLCYQCSIPESYYAWKMWCSRCSVLISRSCLGQIRPFAPACAAASPRQWFWFQESATLCPFQSALFSEDLIPKKLLKASPLHNTYSCMRSQDLFTIFVCSYNIIVILIFCTAAKFI